MPVTRSTAANRQSRAAAPGGGFRMPAMPGMPGGPSSRNREALLLAAAGLVVLLGVILVYLATVKPLEGFEPKLTAGEVVSLNALRSADQLLPVLDAFDSSAERSFVAQEVWKRAHQGTIPNVGELARIRVPVSDIAGDRRLTGFRERLAQARQRAGGGEVTSLNLFTLAQLRKVKPRLVVRTPGQFRSSFWLWTALFFLSFAAVHAVWRFRRFQGDELLLPIALLLTGLGLAVMTSVRDPLRDLPLYLTFIQGAVGGCVLFAACSLVDYERSPLRRMSYAPLFAAFLLSVVLILFGSGPEGSDAKVNLLGFQPVEAIKILVVLFLAGYFFDRWEFLRELPETRGLPGSLARLGIPRFEYFAPPILAIGLVLVFFFLQRDLGPALVLAILFLSLYCIARGQAWMAVVGTAAIVAAFWIGYRLGFPKTVTGRLEMWLSPWDNSFRGGDHLAQSLWAMAGGALSGTGLGLGQPQRVPAVHTDLVLAAVGEELGFLGLLAVVALYVLLVVRGFRAAYRAQGVYSFFLALGLTILVALQILLIAGGIVGVLPLSGVVSPFLSSGRSAMFANFLILGMLAAVSAHPGGPDSSRRFQGPARWTAIALGVVMIAIVAKAAQVQAFQADRFLSRGALTLQGDLKRRYEYNPRLVDIAQSIPRGSIVDRNGVLLATSDPAELEARRAILERLGATLPPAPLKPEKGARYYPFGGRTFHLLGDLNNRVNWGAPNTSYAERDSRIRLQGYDDFAGVVEVQQPDGGKTREIQLDYGELIPLLRYRWRPDHPAVRRILDRDRSLRLAIDVRLQLKAADVLERYARQAGFGGAAVVMDAATGELLASASYPWPKRLPVVAADPGEGDQTRSEIIDRARYGIYPPGSTFKVVTAMAALRKDPGLAAKTFECRLLPDGRVGNTVRGWGKAIRDDPTDREPHGQVNLDKGLVVSCNAFFAQLGTYEVGPEALLETAKKLGISVARPNTPQALKDAMPQASYGQGQVVATPLQMARVAATLANGGAMPEGRWVIDESNTRRAEAVPVLAPDLAKSLAGSLRRVVTQGTGARFLAGVQPAIAGKTGTAEVKDKGSHAWFIGFAPYEALGGRKIAFGVIIEHGGYGGRLAAPAAGEIVQSASELGDLRAQPPQPSSAASSPASTPQPAQSPQRQP
ncbi:MAG TPA: FtsW/RodA/SpoVE family cell cycle protein [Thermoanaerobaculia bacterium]|nr:FtsW/RodA/SpoVE family cell cycle protein [Thermoanaerobaculia bacterium]